MRSIAQATVFHVSAVFFPTEQLWIHTSIGDVGLLTWS